MIIAQTTINNDFLVLLETMAPYIFGGIGAGAAAILKYLTEKEKTKIERAKKKIEHLGNIEEKLKHYQNAMQAVLAQCEALENFGQTFEEGQVTARQLLVLKTGLDRVQAIAEDILADGIFRN
ncbi:MAG: hypothetical protein AAFO04_24015 [Cyanobacteria bacterium J06592_8]